MTQPKSYIIAHRSSPVVGDCVQSLERHGWTYEIVSAVDGNTVSQADWDRIGVQMSKDGKMPRRPGAQGCWHSHFALWKRCVDHNQPIIILEHDAVVMAPWPDHIDIDSQLVKLYRGAECKVNPAFGTWSKGAHAYSLTPGQAQTLIAHAQQNGAQAVDKHLGNRVLPWTFYSADLVTLNPGRGPSSTSPLRK
jgi:GR25 family glycosyltransferase involved in LPS biosynthesis